MEVKPQKIIFLFLYGGFLGWLIDTSYRSFTTGFFQEGGFFTHSTGIIIPFLPIYGLGLVLTYLFCQFKTPLFVRFLILATIFSLLELIAGFLTTAIITHTLWSYQTGLFHYADLIHWAYWGTLGISAHIFLNNYSKIR